MLQLEHLFLQIIHVICQNMKKCVKQIIQLSYDETFLYARLCIFWALCFPHCPAEGFIHLCIHKADSSVPLGVSDFWFGNDVPKSNVLKHPLFITSQQKKRLSYNGLFTERAQDYMINDHESKHVVKHLD